MFNIRLLVVALILAVAPALVFASTTITYQGQLQGEAALYDGEVDMRFALFDSPTAGTQIGPTILREGVAVSDGLFQVELDFGEVISDAPVYLQVEVSGTLLSPRQRMTAAPLAVHALSASAVSLELDEIEDIDTSGAVDGDYLKFDGSNWIAAPDSGGSNWSESVDGLYYDAGNIAMGTADSPTSRLLVAGNGTQDVISAESPAGDTKLLLTGNGGLSIGSGPDEAPDNGLRVRGDAVFDEGNVGVGTQNASDIQKNLHLIHDQYTGLSRGGLAIENEYNGAQWVLYSSQSSSNLSLYFNNGLRGVFDNVSGNYSATSDARLKSQVQAIDGPLDRLMQIKPKQYEFKTRPGKSHYGFLAQDLKEVLPEAVSVSGEDGSGEGGVHTVAYTELIPILVAGVQEQQATIEALRKELDALKDEVESMTN